MGRSAAGGRRRSGAQALLGLALALLALAAGLGLGPGPARAQDGTAQAGSIEAVLRAFPEGMTPEQLDAVLAVMDEDAARAALRARLLAEIDQRAAAQRVAAEGPLEVFLHRLRDVVAAYPTVPGALAATFARPGGLDQPIQPLLLAASILAILAAGLGAMALDRRALARPRAAVAAGGGAGERPSLRRLAVTLLLDSAEIAAFVAGVLIAYVILSPAHPLAPALLLAVLRAALVVLVTEMLARIAFEPGGQRPRLVPLPDRPARLLYRAVVITVLVLELVTAVLRILTVLGMPQDPLAAITLPLSLLPSAYLILLVWREREAVTQAIAARLRIDSREAPLLGAWPVLATAYLVALWLVITWGVLTGQPGLAPKALASLLLLLVAPLAAWLLQRPLARFYDLEEADLLASSAEPRPAVTDEHGDVLPVPSSAPVAAEDARRHVQRLMRAVWIVLITLVVLGTAWIWGFDPEQDGGIGGFVLRLLFNVGVVLLAGYVAWALIVRSINERLEAARREQGSARAQRMATLLPLLRKFLQVVLVTITVMIVLSSLGVDIGPLIAGAGVVGLAIGLGAQQTIADILAGVFFLLEDAFHVGDYVEVGNLRGTVEGISLRSLKLRHHRGAVHTLPFGQMKSLTNHTRDWALMRLEFRVAPETDVALIKKIVKSIGRELQADPELGPGFIEPLKSQGIRNVEDGALIIGVKYIARPGTQFTIRREAYQRIINAFKANGIDLVGRGVVVKVEGPEGADDRTIGAAAAEAVRQSTA